MSGENTLSFMNGWKVELSKLFRKLERAAGSFCRARHFLPSTSFFAVARHFLLRP